MSLTVTALMVALPLASADWGGRGFVEPDTEADRLGGFMFADPDTSSGPSALKQVYFNIYAAHFIAGGNPNVAMARTHVMPYPSSVHGMLGVWKDCNGDGYIGLQEGAFMEYRNELLLNSAVCPPGLSIHNDGAWVREFLWIGPDKLGDSVNETENNPWDDNPYNLVDEEARVWADFGYPDSEGTRSCPVNPRPRGTYQSTGGFLRFVDCHAGWRVTGAATSADDATGGVLGIRFDDAPQERPDQSGSLLNQQNPYGQQQDASMVTVVDCSGDHTEVYDPTASGPGQTGSLRRVGVSDPTGITPDSVTDPTGELGDEPIELKNEDGTFVAVNGTDDDGLIVTVHAVGAPSVDPAGSPAGTVNQTLESTPDRATAPGDSDCDRSEGPGQNSNVYDLEESDFEATTAHRTQSDFYMTFRETTPSGGLTGLASEEAIVGESAPYLLGTGSIAGEGVFGNAPMLWFGAPGYVASRNPYVNRDTLALWGSVVVTGYAKLGVTAINSMGLTLPNGGTPFIYGAEHCDGPAPITGAWNCNADEWCPGPCVGAATLPWLASVGETYNLRDIDCWDASAAGVPSVTATVTGNACPR